MGPPASRPGREPTATSPDRKAAEGPAPLSARIEVAPPGINLLKADGSFELRSAAWLRVRAGADDLVLPPEIDHKIARHGSASARWLIDDEAFAATLEIPLPFDPLPPVQVYRAGAWLRSSRPATVRVDVRAGRTTRGEVIELGPVWKHVRLSFPWAEGERGKSPRLKIEAESWDGTWLLWIDAIGVEAGERDRPYQPSKAPTVVSELETWDGLHFEDGPVTLGVGARGKEVGSQPDVLHWRIRGTTRGLAEGEIPLVEPILLTHTVHQKALPRGWYRATCRLVGPEEGVLAERARGFAVARPMPASSDDRFRLRVPLCCPRRNVLAELLGISVTKDEGDTDFDGAVLDPGAPNDPTTSQASAREPLEQAMRVALHRVQELTAAAARDLRVAHWPLAWAELVDAYGRWQPVAVAVNVWLDSVGELAYARRLDADEGRLRIDVFSREDRHVAIVSVDGAARTGRPSRSRDTAWELPLQAGSVRVRDLFDGPVRLTRRDNAVRIGGPGEVFYIIAEPGLPLGRFVFGLVDMRAVPLESDTRPDHKQP